MWKVLVPSALALMVIGSVAANAQYRSNPLDDFLRGLETRQGNSNMDCTVRHRLLRNGDIRELTIQCYSDRRGYYGR